MRAPQTVKERGKAILEKRPLFSRLVAFIVGEKDHYELHQSYSGALGGGRGVLGGARSPLSELVPGLRAFALPQAHPPGKRVSRPGVHSRPLSGRILCGLCQITGRQGNPEDDPAQFPHQKLGTLGERGESLIQIHMARQVRAWGLAPPLGSVPWPQRSREGTSITGWVPCKPRSDLAQGAGVGWAGALSRRL